MKKIFLMLLGIAATINAMAVDYTAKAVITITSSTGYYKPMIVQEAAIYGNSVVGAEMNFEGNGAFLYGISGGTKLQVVRGADLEGVQLGVKTDAGTEFTFTVSSVEGSNPLYFMDAQGSNYLLENGASFTITDLAANSTIENRFSLGRPSAPVTGYNVTLNGAGLATFSADGDDATIPDGVEAYTATYQDATQEIVLNKITADAIPAGVGVILYGTPGAAVTLPYTDGAAALTAENNLYPATAWATADKNNVFVLSGNQMFKYVGTDPVPANKAFMKLPGGANNAPARISMRFNTTTAVENVEAVEKGVKFMENGQIFIRRGENVYNAQGQMVK